MIRCPDAIWLPGPAWKVGYVVLGRTSAKSGVVDHSSEGPFQATIDVLNGPRNVSWQFTNDDSGLYQHYDVEAVCWHAGFEANKKFVGCENTGRKGEPLTERQYNNLLGLHRWLKERGVLTVYERRVDLWEHNELWPTDCPSGRIPWEQLIADLKEDDMAFTEEDARRLRELHERSRGDYVRVAGTDRVYLVEARQLTHILNPSVLAGLRDGFGDVRDMPPDDEIWRLPVYLPGGLPDELKR